MENNGIDVFLNISDNECILCMNEIDKHDSHKLDCNHYFCKSCINVWLEERNDCPLCSNEINKINNLDEFDEFDEIYKTHLINNMDNTPFNNSTLYSYAVNYNMLRIISGLGGLVYSN